jgi:hypothetical protein
VRPKLALTKPWDKENYRTVHCFSRAIAGITSSPPLLNTNITSMLETEVDMLDVLTAGSTPSFTWPVVLLMKRFSFLIVF